MAEFHGVGCGCGVCRILLVMERSRLDVLRRIASAQVDDDTVVLPNACQGELIALDDATVRCFSVLTKQPHSIPPESWSFIETQEMPTIKEHSNVKSGLLVDHVTRSIIGTNAFRLTFDAKGGVHSVQLLPPGKGPAQQQWEAQAAKMLE